MRVMIAAFAFAVTNAQLVSGSMLKQPGIPPSALTAEDVVTDMWNGRDFGERNAFSFERLAGSESDTEGNAWVQVMGLQNSGTDLLNALLFLNFGGRLKHFSSEIKLPDHDGFWRFANLKAVHLADHGEDKFSSGAVKVLIVIRNPFSWLRTMRENPPAEFQNPHAGGSCTAGQDWLVKSCSHVHPGGPKSTTHRTTYTSLMDVWNQWTASYQHASAFGIENSMVIPYESIVHDPVSVMEQVAKFMNLEEPHMHADPDTPEGFGLTQARASLHAKHYLDSFTFEEKRAACLGLDVELQEYYKYDDCAQI